MSTRYPVSAEEQEEQRVIRQLMLESEAVKYTRQFASKLEAVRNGPSPLESLRKLNRPYVCVPMTRCLNGASEAEGTLAVHPLQFGDAPRLHTEAKWTTKGLCYFHRGEWEVIWGITTLDQHVKVSECEILRRNRTVHAFFNCFQNGVCLGETSLNSDDTTIYEDALLQLDQAITEPPAFIKAETFMSQLLQAADTIVPHTGSVPASKKKPIIFLDGIPMPMVLTPRGPKQCQHCYKVADKVFKCSRCKAVCYCGPACQRADWNPFHRQVCRSVGASMSRSSVPTEHHSPLQA